MDTNDGTTTAPAAPAAPGAPVPTAPSASASPASRALDEAAPLGAADIVRKRPVRTKWVLVPNLGGKVLVRALTGTERDTFEGSLVQQRGKDRKISTANIRAKLCALAIVDPTFFPGEVRRAFTDEQVVALGEIDAGELSKIYDAAAELSGITEADVEELAGNSTPVASAGLSSKSR